MDTQEVSVTGRRTFSVSEKACLQKLIIKHKLHSSARHGPKDMFGRRHAWARLTQEYNLIENNSSRTEAQLKKCWDNIKSRRKQALEHRDRIRLACDRNTASISQNLTLDNDPLMPVKDEELSWAHAHDSDSDNTSKESVVAKASEVSLGTASPPRESALHHRMIQSSETQVTRNNNQNQEREDELHKLLVAERVWLLKTLRERHSTAQLEREKAQFEREKAQFERDVAQLQKEKAQLELNRIMQESDAVKIYEK